MDNLGRSGKILGKLQASNNEPERNRAYEQKITNMEIETNCCKNLPKIKASDTWLHKQILSNI